MSDTQTFDAFCKGRLQAPTPYTPPPLVLNEAQGRLEHPGSYLFDRREGASTALAARALFGALHQSGSVHICVSNTSEQRKLLRRVMLDLLPRNNDGSSYVSETPSTFRFPNGSVVGFILADEGETKMRGVSASALYLDGVQSEQFDREVVRPILASNPACQVFSVSFLEVL